MAAIVQELLCVASLSMSACYVVKCFVGKVKHNPCCSCSSVKTVHYSKLSDLSQTGIRSELLRIIA